MLTTAAASSGKEATGRAKTRGTSSWSRTIHSRERKMERLRCELTDGLARITLVAPDRGNAIDPDWARQFRDAAHGLRDRDDLRVVLLSAQGSAFCVGGDLRYFASVDDPSATLHELAADLHDGMLVLSELDAPLV